MEAIKIHPPLTTITSPFYPSNFTLKNSLFSPSFTHPFPKFTLFNAPISLPHTSSTSHSNIITTSSKFTAGEKLHWMVIMDKPPEKVTLSKPNLVNYYVSTLHKALGFARDEKDAQRCIYDACCDGINFGFCCFADEQTSLVLAGIPGVLSVKPDHNTSSINRDYSFNITIEANSALSPTTLLFPDGSKNWLVCVEKPSYIVSSRAQMVDFYVDVLTKVLGNEKDAQMCLYHTSWQSNYGFCCVLDEQCAQELAAVPGVLSVQPDENFESENKFYGAVPGVLSVQPDENFESENKFYGDGGISSNAQGSAGKDTRKTKLFITGLSFYTSEKTLRAAFEPFGEIVEVKVIMDKISKRSKGYAFVEYSSEDAASTALQEMNGKIINGWMIVVDSARNKPRLTRER